MALLMQSAAAPGRTANRRRRALWFLVFAALRLTTFGAAAPSAPSPEYQVKAVFLFHFAQFVEWPASAFPTAKSPLIIVAKAALKKEAVEGLERWKQRHPQAAAKLIPDDVLVDAMRGRFTAWYRIRVNLRHVPDDERPAAEPPDPDYEPTWGRP